MKPITLSLKSTILAVTTLAFAGCSTQTTDSSVIETETIWANITVASDGERSRVSTELNVSGPTGNNLNLTSGDKLYVRAGGISKQLEKDFDFLDIDYQSYINVTASNELFTISLERPNDSDAQNSTVELPMAFDIHSPIANQVYQGNEAIDIHWDEMTGDQQIYLELVSECKTLSGGNVLQVEDYSIEDDGQYVIVPNQLEMFKNANINKTKRCTFKVFLQRKNFGTPDPLFKNNSKISATQYRQVENVKIDLL